jgi:beta-N-acetylhexosaminidase
MSRLDELTAACLFPSFDGPDPPDWVRRLLAEGGGGVVLFATNVPSREQLAALCATLRGERDGVLLAIDEEGGDVTRLEWREGSSYPGNGALGAIGDTALTEETAAAIGSELAAVGVNWDFAPVADVNVPENPVIGARAFGDEPAHVAEQVAAFVRGLQHAGVAACAKHFPGHGATEQDSHLVLPVVTGDAEDGLPPFRAAIDAGVQTIMTAHVRVPAFGDEPASLNRELVQGLLRDELGFDGLVICDALDMKAVSGSVGAGEAAVRALAAGVDALCLGSTLGEEHVHAIRAAVAGAVADGRLSEGRLREAAARIARVGESAAPRTTGADRGVGRDAARRALHVEGDVAVDPAPSVVDLRPTANIAAGEHRHRLLDAKLVREGGDVPSADVYVVRDAHRHAWMREAADRPGAIVVETGVPVWRPEAARGWIATYGGSRVSLDAVGELLGAAVAG